MRVIKVESKMILTVKGMTCGGCVGSVTRAIQRKAPDATVKIDLPSGRVDVSGLLAPDAARAAIEAAGYEVVSVA